MLWMLDMRGLMDKLAQMLGVEFLTKFLAKLILVVVAC